MTQNERPSEPTEDSPLLGERPQDTEANLENGINGAALGPAKPQEDEEREEEESLSPDSPKLDEARKNVKRMLPLLSVGAFLSFLDQTVIAAINGDIASDLDALRSASWIATSYFLTMTCAQPLYGKLSDVFGRKPCLLFAYAIFALGSLLSGVATNIETMIAGRAIQGVGGGGMLIVVTVLFSDVIPLRERGTYQGYLNLIGAIGSTSGAPIGGLFVESIGWKWIFLIQVIICVVAIILLAIFLRLPKRESKLSAKEQIRRIDFLGALLLILTVTSLLFGLDRGTNISWREPIAFVPLVLSIPLGAAFLWVEIKFAIQPFTPGHVIFNRGLLACYAHNFLAYAGFTSLIFYIPFFFQIVLQMNPLKAGAGLIPIAFCAVFGIVSGGIILKRVGKFYWLAVIASGVAAITSVLVPIAPGLEYTQSLIAIWVAAVVSFIPQGMVIVASLIAILSNVEGKDQAVATASTFLFRSLGMAVGTALVGLLIQSVLGSGLRKEVGPEEASKLLKEIGRGLGFIEDLSPELRAIVRRCYNSGIQSGFALSSGCLFLAAISTWWWVEKRLK